MSDRSQTVSAALTYVLKVWLAGFAAAAFVPLTVGATVIDLATGSTREASLVDRVLTLSAHVEAGIDVHGAKTRIDVVAPKAA